jgi:hypothetical protein
MCGGISRPITWISSQETTIDDFILNQSAYFTGFTLTKTSTSTFTFTKASNFTNASISGSFGSATVIQAFSAGTPVLGVNKSTKWSSYVEGTSSDQQLPILEIIGNEIALQYSRPKQLIQMNIQEQSATAPSFNILGRVEDEINTAGGYNRKFVFNRGEFNIKGRKWMADLIEIIELNLA